jgi:outer membrane protein
LRKAVNASDGLIGNVNLTYADDIHDLFYHEGPPIIFSIGPRVTLVDQKYDQTYFGITGIQSIRSGLPTYSAKGGLSSYGVGAVIVLPITYSLSATLIANADQLADDSANSPLVRQRGSGTQSVFGLFFSYEFDWNAAK